ncbi:MAG: hypothetical protein R3B72_35820 [Polyangiaceae bacterium]
MTDEAANPALSVAASSEVEAERGSLWFSDNPDKAWVEKLFLAYTPVWMASMGVMVLTGWDKSFGNVALLVHAFGTALPLIVVPALLARRFTDEPWHDSYWFKVNLYLIVFSFFASYFGSEYFFDVLGMVYVYPNASTTLDAALVGTGTQTVPLIMYPYAYVYFSTYHATANVALRRLRRLKLPGTAVLFPVFVFVIAYFWSWLETKAMANPMMATSFHYRSLDRMLTYGSAIYGVYFVASFPIYYAIDETRGRRWTLVETCAGALSASMLMLLGLDLITHVIGSL